MSALTKIRDIYNDYLNFVEEIELKEHSKDLYYCIDSFLNAHYDALPVLVYSVLKNNEMAGEKSISRCLWNRKKISGNYSESEINFIHETIATNEDCNDLGHKVFDQKEYNLYISNIGEDEKQKIYLVYKITKSINFEFDKRLYCCVHNSQKKILELNKIENLKYLVNIDDVSGLYNQRKFILDIEKFIERYEKIEEVFCVIFVDIDHFKNVNDRYGHLVGTKLLKEVGTIFKEVLREDDISYRYGGDEFVALIPDGDIECARLISERILKTIKAKTFDVTAFSNEKVELSLSVSIGIAAFPEDAKSKEAIINFADRMMYMAKESGRGRVCLAGSVVSMDDQDANSRSK